MPSSTFATVLARCIGFLLNTLAIVSPRRAGRLAFSLFGRPNPRPAKASETAFLETADLQWLTVNDKKYAVYRWGTQGPLVLVVHGWESQAGRWRKIVPPLVKAGFRVIAVDAPAHGQSEGRHFTMIKYAEVLRALLEKYEGVETIIGHSVGGAASIWAMHKLPADLRPRRAVILASFSAMQTVMDGAQRKVGASPRLMRAFDAYVQEITGAPVAHYSLAKAAGDLAEVEALLVHDRHDKVTPFHESEILEQSWPGARLWATDGFGHGLTAPEVTKRIVHFVTTGVQEVRS